jgi:hypothetical protein
VFDPHYEPGYLALSTNDGRRTVARRSVVMRSIARAGIEYEETLLRLSSTYGDQRKADLAFLRGLIAQLEE